MIKLNGKIYLSYNEVESELTNQLKRLSTSQHATLPNGIPYLDVEFITQLKDKLTDIVVGIAFLYKTENCVEFNEIVDTLSSFFYDKEICDPSLQFITLQLTDSQRSVKRKKYYHYLFNVFVGEIVKNLISKFV